MTKKLLSFALATLLFVGITVIANATNIPTSTEPKNYPTVWTEQVYNGSGSAIVSGFIVVWDFDTSNSSIDVYDDMCPWVKVSATNDSVWTAGVVPLGQSIANETTGAIVIKGPTPVWRGQNGTALTVDTICASSSTGTVEDESIGGGDTSSLGIVIKASAAANDVGGDATADFSLIYVNPQTEAN